MIDISSIIKDYIEDEWIEDNPAISSIALKFDEKDPDPIDGSTLQILFENGSDKKTWITRNIYKIEHNSKITIFVGVVNYIPTTIDETKIIFLNMKNELDRILNLRFGITGILSVELSGWKDIDIETGKDSKGKTGIEPIVWKSEQTIKCQYYEGNFA